MEDIYMFRKGDERCLGITNLVKTDKKNESIFLL